MDQLILDYSVSLRLSERERDRLSIYVRVSKHPQHEVHILLILSLYYELIFICEAMLIGKSLLLFQANLSQKLIKLW